MTPEALSLLVGIIIVLSAVAGRLAYLSWRGKGPLVHREYLREPAPEGYGAMIAGGVPVKGVSFGGRQRRLKRFIKGQDRRIQLVPCPDNRHDANAIQVTGQWTDEAGQSHGPADLGWIPKELAADMAAGELADECAATLTCIFHARWPAYHGLRLALWAPLTGPDTAYDQINADHTQ
ncbi:MAG: hypothetical protein Alpg2KO_03040 [Alphaproteobacteria bacterium]